MFHDLIDALEKTLFMVFTASILTILLGFPLSVVQAFPKSKSGSTAVLHSCIKAIIQLIAAIPYIVIMIALIPIAHWLMGTQHGTVIAVIPLTLASVPLFTKVCMEAFAKIPKGLKEAMVSLGATKRQLLFKVILPEAIPDIIYGFSQVLIQILGFSVVLGVLGAGGIGALLVEKGYKDYQTSYVLGIIVTLIILVIGVQMIGRFLAYGSLKTKAN